MVPLNLIKRFYQRPGLLLISTFSGLALLSTVLLKLPVAQADPEKPVSWLDALFLASSATCVTGLITVDPPTQFSRFGLTVILITLQLGGLGVMTFGAATAVMLRMRVSFSSQAVLQDTFFQTEAAGDLRRALRLIILMTLAFEAAGAGLIYFGLQSISAEVPRGAFEAVFLAISAFCNAGFSVYPDSLMSVRQSALVVWTIMLLIVLGGIGYAVLLEFFRRLGSRIRRRQHRPVRWSLHTRVATSFSLILIMAGTLLLLLTGLSEQDLTWAERIEHALFQSVTARTAGFNTVNITALPLASLMIIMPLMLIGGSPGSTAGGIKTTTTAVWGARIFARLNLNDNVSLGGRRLPADVVRRAALIIAIAILWNLIGVFLLVLTESAGDKCQLEDVIFEQISAFATVGLSTGLTPALSTAGKWWIIATMFVGRLGPLTIAVAVLHRKARSRYAFAHERLMIG